jgi:hypothetical protein
VRVFYLSTKSRDTSDETMHSLIGECKCSLAAIMRSKSQTLSLPVDNQGTIELKGETFVDTRDVFSCSFRASRLTSSSFCTKPDSFITISR